MASAIHPLMGLGVFGSGRKEGVRAKGKVKEKKGQSSLLTQTNEQKLVGDRLTVIG
jgi:hypothetical protein